MPANDFLTFAVGAGANVLTQANYASSSFQGAGFTAGIADSASLNKVWRQSAFITSVLAQFIANQSNSDVLDNGDAAAMLALLEAALSAFISGSITGGTRPPTVVNANFAIAAAQNQAGIYVTGVRTGTLAKASTLSNGLWFDLQATNGAVTLTPNAADSINGGAAGASFSIPAGIHVLVFTDGASKWYVFSDLLAIANSLPQFAAGAGAANAYTATYSPARTAHVVGVPLSFSAPAANTGASTFNPGPGAKALVRPDNTPLVKNDILLNGIITAVYDGTAYRAVSGLTNGFTLSAAASGYEIHPDGLIIQWGSVTMPVGSNVVTSSLTFPLQFPNANYGVQATITEMLNIGLNWNAGSVRAQTQTVSGCVLVMDSDATNVPITSAVPVKWFAVGR